MIDTNKILTENGLTETELIFKTKLKRLRQSQPDHPTLQQTADRIGMKYGKYRLLESYTPVNVKFETIELIAQYYNIPPYELFKL